MYLKVWELGGYIIAFQLSDRMLIFVLKLACLKSLLKNIWRGSWFIFFSLTFGSYGKLTIFFFFFHSIELAFVYKNFYSQHKNVNIEQLKQSTKKLCLTKIYTY